MRNRHDRRFGHGRMTHQRVLERDGADPLATRFDHVLQAVLNDDRSARVDGGDVARLEPAICREPIAVLALEVGADDPWTSYLELTDRRAVPRHDAFFVSGPDLDERR